MVQSNLDIQNLKRFLLSETWDAATVTASTSLANIVFHKFPSMRQGVTLWNLCPLWLHHRTTSLKPVASQTTIGP